jgi:hypothetical protein
MNHHNIAKCMYKNNLCNESFQFDGSEVKATYFLINYYIERTRGSSLFSLTFLVDSK